MASPTPSELLWITGYPVRGRWLLPLLRDAIHAEWPEAVDLARTTLRDPECAREMMENAIGQTHSLLADRDVLSLEEVREVLKRCYRNAVKRRYRKQSRIRLLGLASDLESIAPRVPTGTAAVDAKLDLEALLEDTPQDLRRALLMRYGARSSWREVAQQFQTSEDGIRMRCQRELKRLGSSLRVRFRKTKRTGERTNEKGGMN